MLHLLFRIDFGRETTDCSDVSNDWNPVALQPSSHHPSAGKLEKLLRPGGGQGNAEIRGYHTLEFPKTGQVSLWIAPQALKRAVLLIETDPAVEILPFPGHRH